MSRSWVELKILFFIMLPLLCAARTFERGYTLIFTPIEIQQKIFGRVVAYPWQLRSTDIRIFPEASMHWTYAEADIPKPLKRCAPSVPDPRWPGPIPSCSVTDERSNFSAEWSEGQIKIGDTRPSLEDAAEAGN